MDQKWENELKGQVVLFEWIQFLQFELMEVLGILDGVVDLSWAYTMKQNSRKSTEPNQQSVSFSIESAAQQLDSRAVSDNQLKTDLIEFLVDYDKSEKKDAFDRTFFTCKVCFLEKLGSSMMQFPICNHVFCKECMKDFFKVRISDGSVNGLCCPEEKCTSQASPGQVN